MLGRGCPRLLHQVRRQVVIAHCAACEAQQYGLHVIEGCCVERDGHATCPPGDTSGSLRRLSSFRAAETRLRVHANVRQSLVISRCTSLARRIEARIPRRAAVSARGRSNPAAAERRTACTIRGTMARAGTSGGKRASVMLVVRAGVLASLVPTHALAQASVPAQAPAESAPAESAATAEAAAEPTVDSPAPAPDAVLSEDMMAPSSQGLSADAERAQLAKLRAELLQLEREQDDVDQVLPWSVLALGAAAVIVGTVLGIERASACDASCPGPFWPSWLVVGGATVGTLGLVWLKLEHEELSALRSRHYHLQNQIDAYELNRATLAPRLTLRAAF
jgi:hypothetical protein